MGLQDPSQYPSPPAQAHTPSVHLAPEGQSSETPQVATTSSVDPHVLVPSPIRARMMRHNPDARVELLPPSYAGAHRRTFIFSSEHQIDMMPPSRCGREPKPESKCSSLLK